MFGNNPIRSAVNNPDVISIVDHFYTIQGEGPFMGRPALFIRLAGCNLACTFCDTEFEQGTTSWETEKLVEMLVNKYHLQRRQLIVITGGEPMRQPLEKFCLRLLQSSPGAVIQIETAGTLYQEGAVFQRLIDQERIVLVCSPKTPKVHPKIRDNCDHWKYVIKYDEVDEERGLPKYGTQPATRGKLSPVFYPSNIGVPEHEIYLSPCDEYDEERNRRNLHAVKEIALTHGYRVSLQMHKILQVP